MGNPFFGELFESIDGYHYQSEPPFAEVMNADYSVPQAFKVPHESEEFDADPGLSFPLNTLLGHVPDMQFFWLVRHPFDAICSLRIGIGKEWGHHPRPQDWIDWLERPLVERCAHHWAFLNSVGFENVSKIVTVVRFEDMIESPGRFAQGICDLLGLDGQHKSASVQSWVRRVRNTNDANFIEAQTSRPYSRPDHSIRIGRWRENLSKNDVVRVLPIVAEAAKQFGCDLNMSANDT